MTLYPEASIVWYEDIDGTIKAELKRTRMGAKRAYLKLSRNSDYLACGWAQADHAVAVEREAAGLTPFPALPYCGEFVA